MKYMPCPNCKRPLETHWVAGYDLKTDMNTVSEGASEGLVRCQHCKETWLIEMIIKVWPIPRTSADRYPT